MMRTEGSLSLYKGFTALMLRDVPGWGVYFWSYEYLKDLFGIKDTSKDQTTLNILILMWCGGVAGQLSWLVGYPFDIVKTQI